MDIGIAGILGRVCKLIRHQLVWPVVHVHLNSYNKAKLILTAPDLSNWLLGIVTFICELQLCNM